MTPRHSFYLHCKSLHAPDQPPGDLLEPALALLNPHIHHAGLALRLQLRMPLLARPPHVHGAKAQRPGGPEIVQMRGDHGALGGRTAQAGGGAEVDLGRGLVGLEHLGGGDVGEGHGGVAAHVLQQRDVAVRQRAGREARVQRVQPRRRVGPCGEPVPDEGQLLLLRSTVQGRQAVLREQRTQRVQVVLVHSLVRDAGVVGGEAPREDQVRVAPGLCYIGPLLVGLAVERLVELCGGFGGMGGSADHLGSYAAGLLVDGCRTGFGGGLSAFVEFVGDGGSPVDTGAEDIEEERLEGRIPVRHAEARKEEQRRSRQ
nr:hypothetical protein CFP56_19602 [Quercus suber]